MRTYAVVAVLAMCLQAAAESPQRYHVRWDSPSKDHMGSMPLGNGEISLNAWVELNGDLCFYVGKSDSWDDNGRLLKLGKVRVKLDPAPSVKPFRQELSLVDGTMKVRYGDGTVLDVWVDANHPIIHVSVAGRRTMTATASIELWRKQRTTLPVIEISDTMYDRSKPDNQHAPTVVEPDTVIGAMSGRIGWFHYNIKSVGPAEHARVQGVEGFNRPDPLFHRTFGAMIDAPEGRRINDTTLESPRSERHRFDIYVLTKHPATPQEWRRELEAMIDRTDRIPLAARRRAHEQWWRTFWNRSWIVASSQTPPAPAPINSYPLRVGVTQADSEQFVGEIFYADAEQAKDFSRPFKLKAQVNPQAGGFGRIFDKVTPGGSDGFLLDIRPGNILRLIVGPDEYTAPNAVPVGQWSTIEVDASAKGWKVSVDGKVVISTPESSGEDEASHLSRMYALQRFVTACAGRGGYPIKFNGSIFTVPEAGAPGDADYRRWGPGYWWQNTRIPYLSLAASGDLEMLDPLMRMYVDEILPLNRYRTKQYFGFENAAYFAECIHFWGDVFNESYGWTPWNQRKDPLQESGWHKWEWVAGPELVWMMIEAYEHSGDEALLQKRILPTTEAVVNFFDKYYKRGENGKLIMHPSQSLETWWDCVNPMPEVAGLHSVLDKLLALPKGKVPESHRTQWSAFKSSLPDLPVRMIDGKPAFAPAEKFAKKSNVENGELYAVFPFRLSSFEKPNRDLAVRALEHRWDRGNSGWRQDDVFMAYLGLTDQARQSLVARSRNYDRRMRFPAFWGPNYDWTPDQTHGGILMKVTQSMLMQTDGDRIFLLPAWPKDWEVSFKLHAPKQTTVEGTVRGGKVVDLKVTPKGRRKDVEVVGG
jgi:hypothetical protein